MAKIVTLTTDWHNSDYYIGAVKASILSECQDAVFVDISHNIEHFNWQQAGFILKSLVDDFPKNTIHIIGVGSEPDAETDIVVAKYRNQYFIGANNGSLGIIFSQKPDCVVSVDFGADNEECCFVEKNIFSQIAKYIYCDGDIMRLGEINDDVKRYTEVEPQITPKGILGSVIYIDSYGNAITNIRKEFFEEVVGDSKFEILLNTLSHKTNRISLSYKDVEEPEIVCLFNSVGLLEVALRGASAHDLLGLRYDSRIRIDIVK